MDRHADLAGRYEFASSPALRRLFGERYRRLIGVYPEYRETFRSALERVRNGGGMSVKEVIEVLQSPHSGNALSAPTGLD